MNLLVGARYGISQILNHKLNMISTIIDFHYITRVELLSESERVSMLKIYLQDIKVQSKHTHIHTHTRTHAHTNTDCDERMSQKLNIYSHGLLIVFFSNFTCSHLPLSPSVSLQPLALLMDSVAAKDLACLLAGYCRLLVDPNMNVFRWGGRPKMRRIPVEEGKDGTMSPSYTRVPFDIISGFMKVCG